MVLSFYHDLKTNKSCCFPDFSLKIVMLADAIELVLYLPLPFSIKLPISTKDDKLSSLISIYNKRHSHQLKRNIHPKHEARKQLKYTDI